MSGPAMVTIAAPLALSQVTSVREKIGKELGNPAGEAFEQAVMKTETPFLHFASLHALERSDGRAGHLILEFSADGGEIQAMTQLADSAGDLLKEFFEVASDWKAGTDLLDYWKRHQVKIGFGLFDTPGLPFCGTPEMTVDAIRRESNLSDRIGEILAECPPDAMPLERLKSVRDGLAGEFDWALDPAPPPVATPDREPGTLVKIFSLIPSFTTTFLWPLLLFIVPLAIWLVWPDRWVWTSLGVGQSMGMGDWLDALRQIAGFIAGTAGLILAFILTVLAAIYFAFARQEARDFTSDRNPTPEEAARMVGRENAPGYAQNHMMSHTVMKPGWIRMLTIRLAFYVIARFTAFNPKAGHLGDIGTIHFARWVTIPGTRDFFFFSNYGGSWESYLEDFITKAHAGLTAVWSNTVGFPRSRNLFQDGATDGERFKRYARQSMVHTPFWYCAYPWLTTSNIRSNREIRRGVAAAMSEADAVEWLANFGSASRPVEQLETTQIQSLVFGGMGFKPEGRLLIVDLGGDTERNREWLNGLMPEISFGDGREDTRDAIISLAASVTGLARLGLDHQTIESFPAAFTQGMHGGGRERILGDTHANAKDHWEWGRDGNDIALLVYGNSMDDVDALSDRIAELTVTAQGEISFSKNLSRVGATLEERKEPFGFVDGVSQPAMRGTYRGRRNDDPIHLVEPGEFVLGYPDNRGNVPPGPEMEAGKDPGLRLPVAGEAQGFAQTVAENPRLIGYNGSFLVIRQLAQHAQAFEGYCAAQARVLKASFPDLPIPPDDDDMKAFIAAKMIGRWQDGSSLVRYPYLPASRLRKRAGKPPKPIKPDNDFLFGTEDPQGLRCPFGSHVRRTNPRESLSPGSDEQVAITNRHRVLRVGRGYVSDDGKETAGLMFMCLNGDIERQFEFIQQTWMGSTKFHGLAKEADPIAGRGLAGGDGYTIPTRRGPVGLSPLPQFVTVKGGGYFFLPGRQLLNFLAAQ